MNTNIIGLIGELQACNVMDKSKAGLYLKYISSFPVKGEADQFFQVDTLVICTKGIFCVEVKNWDAKIYCSSNYYWDIEYDSGSKSVKSPISQNLKHCSKVSAVCDRNVQSIILFTDSANLVEPLPNVMYVSDFIPYLAEMPNVLTVDEIESLYISFTKYKQKTETAMLVNFIFKNLT